MQIVWDEPKRQANIREHDGLDFADLTNEFFETALIKPAHSGRMAARGMFAGKSLVVIYRPLGTEAVSVISMYFKKRPERNHRNE